MWVCPACTVCPQCHKRLKAGSQPGTWCQSCAYPPCAGCQQVARPGGDHAYHAKHRPFWRCDKCALASCPMCQANPLGQDAGGGPDAACPQCAERGPKCASMQTANGRPPAFTRLVPRVCLSAMCSWLWSTAPKRNTDAELAKYHAKLMPQWTCQPCQLSQNEPAKRRKIQVDDQADALPPLPPPAEPPEQNASPAASFGQPKKRKPLSTPTPAERYSAPAEAGPSMLTCSSFFWPTEKKTFVQRLPGFFLAGRSPGSHAPRRVPAILIEPPEKRTRSSFSTSHAMS